MFLVRFYFRQSRYTCSHLNSASHADVSGDRGDRKLSFLNRFIKFSLFSNREFTVLHKLVGDDPDTDANKRKDKKLLLTLTLYIHKHESFIYT